MSGRGKRNNKRKGKKSPHQPQRQQKSKEELELEAWDDEQNPYLTVVRKRLRNLKKKLDKADKLKELDRSTLNADQHNSLKRAPGLRELYEELNTVFTQLKKIAKPKSPKKPAPPVEAEEAKEDKKEEEEVVEEVKPEPPAAPQTPVEVLVSLFHASKICPSDPQQAGPVLMELEKQKVACTHDQLRELKTLNSLVTGGLCVDDSSPARQCAEAMRNVQALIDAEDSTPMYTPNLTYAAARTLIEAIQATPLWTAKSQGHRGWLIV